MKYAAAVSLLLSFSAFSASYSEISFVSGLTVGGGYVRVKLENMKEAEGCKISKFYYLQPSSNQEIFSSLLAMKAAKQKVSFQLSGCQNDMPVITHMYMCDTDFCN
ncbi:hypothetical protein [Gallaecimonas xiamenensis]|uniref:hypothetical protein n=1 Tax=Gallaecimonas xiamenensis TaxID=1207039 RepID=UPI0012EA6B64|nr:hypothetical protein [Gallaecimonas xiamenensis]